MPKKDKEVVIIAGANGSGKTTFARAFLDETKYEFLNADEYAKELNPEDPTKARISAGKKLINRIGELIKEEKSFVIESTLAGSYLKKQIENLRSNGYQVSITYVYSTSQNLCIERIKTRVLQGGHDVPDEDVIRRFNRGLRNFWYMYKDLANYINIAYNYEYYDFKHVAYGNPNELNIMNKSLYKKFLKAISEVENGK